MFTYNSDVIFGYDESGHAATMNYNGTTYSCITNIQGDVLKIVNSSGTAVATYIYNAWGELLSSSGSLAAVKPIRYRSYYYDAETGFYYLQSRYYDPVICRFINADVVMTTNASLQGYNLFTYCYNNPVRYLDKKGYNTVVAETWVSTMWWLSLIDGPFPFGDIFYWGGGMILAAIAIDFVAEKSDLPNQGTVSEIPDAPPVDAGKQGKHVKGHNNSNPQKTQWEEGESGVRETQEAWQNGASVKPDGSVRVGTASDGRRIRVHMDNSGNIHGYPLDTPINMVK